MRAIPKKLKEDMLDDTDYFTCMRKEIFNDHVCLGRITLEHAFIYAGKQINEKWAIMSLCAWGHDVDQFQGGNNLDKEKNQYVCVIRATEEDLKKYPRTDWEQLKKYLFNKYGEPKQSPVFTLF